MPTKYGPEIWYSTSILGSFFIPIGISLRIACIAWDHPAKDTDACRGNHPNNACAWLMAHGSVVWQFVQIYSGWIHRKFWQRKLDLLLYVACCRRLSPEFPVNNLTLPSGENKWGCGPKNPDVTRWYEQIWLKYVRIVNGLLVFFTRWVSWMNGLNILSHVKGTCA